MKFPHQSVLCAVVVLLCSTVIPAAESATQPALLPTKAAALAKKYARQLGSADPIDVQAGIIGLSCLDVEAFPTIVAEVDDPTLSAQAKQILKKYVAQQSPMQPARERLRKIRLAHRDWNIETALAAYDKFGRRDPKWDDAAKMGIREFMNIGKTKGEGTQQLETAIAAGCDDPLILYVEARALEMSGTRNYGENQQLYDQSVQGFLRSSYPASRKMYACERSYWHLFSIEAAKAGPGNRIAPEGAKKLNSLLEEVGSRWPEFLEENPPDLMIGELATLAIDGINTSPWGRKKMFDEIDSALKQKRRDAPITLRIEGHFYIKYAWDARGSGTADTVTPEGYKQMMERLDLAEKTLTEAWETDHNNWEAATEMLSVVLANGSGRDQMELWFKRAMQADPDNIAACKDKMYYLQPKWHGSVAEMLEFANECVQTQNWKSRLPFMQEKVFFDLADYAADRNAFWLNPQIWPKIKELCEPWLRYDPSDVTMRVNYCKEAYWCGQYKVAKKQMDLLGDSPQAAEKFGGAAAMEQWRGFIEKKISSPNTP